MLVFEGRLDPTYVLDKMTFYEMKALLDGLWMSNRDSWEQSRLQAYITAKSHAKRGSLGSITNFFQLPWDNKESDFSGPAVTAEDKARLEARAKAYEDFLKKKK